MVTIATYDSKRSAESAAKAVRHASYNTLLTYIDQGRSRSGAVIIHSATPVSVARGQPWRVSIRFSTPELTPMWGYLARDNSIIVGQGKPKA